MNMKTIKEPFFIIVMYICMICFTHAYISEFRYDKWCNEKISRYHDRELSVREIDMIYTESNFKQFFCSLTWPLYWATELSSKMLTSDLPSVSVSFENK